ncbi:MAG TPA: SpoIIE family protein phosphatase [Thermoanaerobaculia bacterium]|nr:SpoIIE family protein phosphatase [Thermoanaerobaculia bacterium]
MTDWSLRVVPPQGDPYEHPLDEESVIIGRASDSGLALADRFLSRHHARLYCEEDAWVVEDLGSRNGTLVNGQVIGGPTSVAPGDTIRVSGTNLTLHRRGDSATAERSILGRSSSATIYRDAKELLSGSSAEKAHDPAQLRGLLARMRLLNEVHQALSRFARFDQLLDLILDRVFAHLRPEEAVIFLQRPDGGLERAASRSLPGLEGKYLYSQSLIREVTEKRVAAFVVDAASDERFAQAQSMLAAGVRSLLAAPLLDPGGCQGMIVVNSRSQVRQFTEEDLELLVSLASVAAMRLRNVALAEEAAQRRLLEQELSLARQLQIALLPAELPQLPGYELHGYNIPSRTVSGDYYYAVTRREQQEFFLMLADVSGKGVAASLLTASLEALSAGPIEDGLPPGEIAAKVGELLRRRTPQERYATAFLATVDVASGALQYTNAGHNAVLLARREGEVELLKSNGLPLGLLPDAAYRQGDVVLAPGDLLLVYTDGVTEATNPDGEEFGIDRLVAVARRHAGSEIAAFSRGVEQELESFARGVPFADDRTLLLLRRLPD